MYVDVHNHLVHESFSNDLDEIIDKALKNNFYKLVINGLNPSSNRKILELYQKYPNIIVPALGMYPVDVVAYKYSISLPFVVHKFNPYEELEFIKSQINQGVLKAIGECGMDGYWIKKDTYEFQKEIFLKLIELAKYGDIPIIVHSRGCENLVVQILESQKVQKVCLHCFGGSIVLAQKCTQQYGWYFSIPTSIIYNTHFQNLVRSLPLEYILTETDAPFLSPQKNTRNEPTNIIKSIQKIAELTNKDTEFIKNQILINYKSLFEHSKA